MFFSIIVPIYNAADMLERSIGSVLSQQEKDWELILVDDGSTDHSAQVCRAYCEQDSRIRLITGSNQGVSHARNTGIDHARGEYLCFLDADDWLADGTLLKLKESVRDVCADVVFTGFVKEYRSGSEYVTTCPEAQAMWQPGKEGFDPFHTRLLGTVWGKIYRREFVGENRFDETLHLCEDAELNYRLLPTANTMLYLNFPGYHYVYYAGSAVRGFRPERIDQYRLSLDRIRGGIGSAPAAAQKSFEVFTCNVLSVIVMNNLYSPQNPAPYRQKRNYLKNLMENQPFRTAVWNVDAGAISKQQFALVWLVRNRLYFGVWLLSLMNRLRNKYLNY